MANVDVTLHLTNPALYNQLQALVNNPHTINITIAANTSNVSTMVNNIHQQLQNIPVTITPTLNNVNQLRASVTAAIGNIPINVSIANLAALNAQIAQIFANAGINVGNYNNPPRGGARGQSAARSLGRILASQIRSEDNPIDPRLGNVERTLGVLSGQPGINGVYNEQALRGINRARETVARRNAKYNSQFNEERLFEIAILGRAGAAAEFEQEKGLRAGTIGRQGPRFSFDISRAFNTRSARNELGFAALFGGVPGALGGLVGGGVFGAGGVFLGSALFQKGLEFAKSTLDSIGEAFTKTFEKGVEFERNVIGIQSALENSSQIFRNGKRVDTAEEIAIQRQRSLELVSGAQKELAPLGIGTGNQAAILRGVTTGLGEAGFKADSSQILKISKLFGSGLSASPLTLQKGEGTIINAISDIINQQPGAQREDLGVLYKKVFPRIKEALNTGDVNKLIEALEKMDGAIKVITNSTNNSALGFQKIQANIETLSIKFSQAFVEQLGPGLNKLADALAKPQTITALESLGETLGKFVNGIIELGANLASFLAQHPEIAKIAVGLTGGTVGGATAGAVIGAGIGTFTPVGPLGGALIGAAGGGLLGAGIGGAFGATPISAKAAAANNQNYQVKTETSPQNLLGKITQNLSGVDQDTILGKLENNKASLAGQLVQNKITLPLYKDKVNTAVNQAKSDYVVTYESIIKGINDFDLFLRDTTDIRLKKLPGGKFPGSRTGPGFPTFGKTGTSGITTELPTVSGLSIDGKSVTSKFDNGLANNFNNLNSAIKATFESFYQLSPAAKDLATRLEQAKEAQKDLDDSRRLEALQGTDKLYEIARQIKEKGGNVPFSQVLGYSQFDVGNEEKAGDRKLAILQSQFEQESKKYNSFTFGLETDRQKNAGERNINALENEKRNLPATNMIQDIQKTNEMLGFLSKFDDNQLEGLQFVKEGGGTFSGKDLKKDLNDRLAKQFNIAGGGNEFDKLKEKIGSGDKLVDISETLKKLFDELVKKVEEGASNAISKNFP